jgi:hypothetical protein
LSGTSESVLLVGDFIRRWGEVEMRRGEGYQWRGDGLSANEIASCGIYAVDLDGCILDTVG